MVFRTNDQSLKIAFAIGIVAFAIRLIGLDHPFVDEWSWRQSDVAAIARNFYTNGFHFARPQIDWAGKEPGYVGTEFPILPFLAALTYRFAGIHEWIGRGQALLLFALSLPFFFLLIRKLFNSTAACWALVFYSFAPLEIMASHCFMPDVPSLSLSLAGLYLFLLWTEAVHAAAPKRLFFAQNVLLLGAALAVSLAILIKIPTALIGVPLAVLAFDRFGFSALRRLDLWLFGVIALLPSGLWYWHAHRISEQFYPYHFFGAGGFALKPVAWYLKIAWFTLSTSLTVLFSALTLAGLVVSAPTVGRRLFFCWGGTILLFVVAAGYGNRHPWYQLPLIPIAAAFAGNFCSALAGRFQGNRTTLRGGALLLAIGFGVLSFINTRLFYHESGARLRALGLEIKASTPPSSLIVAPDYGDPTVFYYAERKGWHFMEKSGIYDGHPIDSAGALAGLEELRGRGATHFVLYADTFWWLDYYKEFARELDETATIVVNNSQCRIYRLPAWSK